MISISKKPNNLQLLLIGLFTMLTLFSGACYVEAQESLTLSVTPTLFEMSVDKGQTWKSSVKVVNANSYPITIYAQPTNFAPQGESGQGKFIPVFEDVTDGSTLAEWINLDPQTPYQIAPQQSLTIPFTISVPEDAAPGGHFAAILVGTRPPEGSNKLTVKTSQLVSSLFFVRVQGDVIEEGRIRSFSVLDHFVPRPEAEFELRFENLGNVHIQPQGQIVIYNMWGKERGRIPINMQTHFGNVLPESIRKFDFTWEGEFSLADIGRYRAEVGLAYGSDHRKFSTSEARFWVIPLKPLLLTLGILMVFILFVVWAIKAYVRRMLMLAGVNPNVQMRPEPGKRARVAFEGDVAIGSYKSISAPVRTGIKDFWEHVTAIRSGSRVGSEALTFLRNYKLFFVAALGLVIVAVSVTYYIRVVTVDSRSYEVQIDNPTTTINLNSEEIVLNELAGETNTLAASTTQPFTIKIVNTSGQTGIAAKAAISLAGQGYASSEVTSEPGRIDKRSIVVFDSSLSETALDISRILGGALPSATEATDTEAQKQIVIYVGKDQISNQ